MSPKYLQIIHLTRFIYSKPIQENTMSAWLHPLDDEWQSCHSFKLTVTPDAYTSPFVDAWGNTLHHFDIPQQHARLEVLSEAVVHVAARPALPEQLPLSVWDVLDLTARDAFWHFLNDSHFVRQTDLLRAFSAELFLGRSRDPLTTLHYINSSLYNSFTYDQQQTKVDSPIDVALKARGGVCQDFAHIMLALVRPLGIPCRYVSGYLLRDLSSQSSERSVEDESHAWVEAWLPDQGWVGFDPTNNLVVSNRHVRVAVGRDYADVPPTRGVFIGDAETELSVGVQIKEVELEQVMDEVNSAELLPALAWQATAPRRNSMWQAQQQQQ